MTINEINAISDWDKKFLNKTDMLIRYKNRRAIFIMKNYFSKLNLEFQVFTDYTLLPNLAKSESYSSTQFEKITEYLKTRRETLESIDNYSDPQKQKDNIILKSICETEEVRFLIRYPELTVTNENNESVVVRNLYALASFRNNILSHLDALVSSYSYGAAVAGYAFSHIRSIVWSSDNPVFFYPCCLGDGPIVTLKSRMIFEYGQTEKVKDQRITMMCMNIDRYFHIESISGGPYIRMNSVGNDVNGYNIVHVGSSFPNVHKDNFSLSNIFRCMVKDALVRMVNDGKFFINVSSDLRKSNGNSISDYGFGSYSTTDGVYGFCIEFSKYFKKIYAEYSLLYDDLPDTNRLISDSILSSYYNINGVLYQKCNMHNMDFSNINGRFLFEFNKKRVCIEIDGKHDSDNYKSEWFVTISLCNVIQKYYRDIISCKRVSNMFNNSIVV